jgi:hypothetical protein
MHDVAWDEDDGGGTGDRSLITDRQLIGAFYDEEDFVLVEMDVVGRAFTGFVPSGGPSPGLCHAMSTAMAPPVASVVRSTFMLRPKALIIGV